MSFLSRLWSAVRRPVRYVGRDLEGNRFYEAPSPNDPSRLKRTVEYYDPEAVWKYVGGGKRLPIQWSAWLTHTRKHPPTLQELQMDLERQQRVLANAAMIEARDRAEAEEMLRIRQKDAAQALEEATTRALGSSLVHQGTHLESTTQAVSQAEPASSGDASEPSRTTKTKFQPPKFLTPATPRNPKSTAKFQLPRLEDPIKSPAELSEVTAEPSTGVPPKSDTSRSTSETESWTPKARQRG